MIGIAACFIFPLCMLRNVSSFRYMSMIILMTMAFICGTLFFELPDYFDAYYSPEAIKYAEFGWDFFPCFATTVFSYACHVQLINIYDEMSEPSQTGGY